MTDELRMNAYYYGFDLTGVYEIDKILSAVAVAGKAFHHTENWNEDCAQPPPFRGTSPVEWIQNAANDAAAQRALIEAIFKAVSDHPENSALGSTVRQIIAAAKEITQ